MSWQPARTSHRFQPGSVCFRIIVAVVAFWASPQAHAQQASQEDNGAQVMTRGPVHEAFAAPLIHDPKPGPIIKIEPPNPVEEQPPDQKPVGASVQWIPGYWQWDDGRNDFLWISGVWRDPPPGRQWVPGYWNQVSGGYQWVPGAWVPAQQQDNAPQSAANPAAGQSAYLSAPPASLEVGPNSPSPGGSVFWSPGCWNWQGARYVWRPGFWAAVQPGWVWMPSQFVWTPSGYLFVPGYWDLPVASRGLLFAPIYYPQPIYLQPGYVYTPSVTIVSTSFTANLFVQPAYSQYCFGDYYATSYLNVGIFPWFSMSFSSGPVMPRYYDPLFSYYSVVNVRTEPRWVTRVHEQYIVRRDNIAMRPPRTLVEQTRMVRVEGPRGAVRERVEIIARPVGELARHPNEMHSLKIERVDASARREWQTRGAELNRYRQERIALEREGARSLKTGDRASEGQSAPRPLALDRSPIGSRPHPAQVEHERRQALTERRSEQLAHAGRGEAQPQPRRQAEGIRSQPNRSERPLDRRPEANRPPQFAGMRNGPRPPQGTQAAPRANQQHSGGRAQSERRPPPHPTPVGREHHPNGKG